MPHNCLRPADHRVPPHFPPARPLAAPRRGLRTARKRGRAPAHPAAAAPGPAPPRPPRRGPFCSLPEPSRSLRPAQLTSARLRGARAAAGRPRSAPPAFPPPPPGCRRGARPGPERERRAPVPGGAAAGGQRAGRGPQHPLPHWRLGRERRRPGAGLPAAQRDAGGAKKRAAVAEGMSERGKGRESGPPVGVSGRES
ncbi:Leucine-Rich Repeat Transmembrane Protein Flrt2 [Manis pentadactyla]|nr:Leucine-Rich Repeat Transmembrane Protein Flrt2 [Manis pentadactyla]